MPSSDDAISIYFRPLSVSVDCITFSTFAFFDSSQFRLQEILSRLVNSHPSVVPENCCLLNAQLDAARFVEAYQRIDAHHYSALTSIFNLLLTSPRSVAELLSCADDLSKETDGANEDLVRCVFNFVYGCCVFPSDERRVLEVLSHLVHMQVASDVDPRRVLRKGSAAFCRLYRLFSDGLFAAKIFLTAALHDPVMYVLSQDELFLDIDPSKSAIRFPPEERRKRCSFFCAFPRICDCGCIMISLRMFAYLPICLFAF
uniref:Ras-GAP domain-containing protein n=1 Tax=Parascaris univalens TaxID=6257 RepID=A0A914ZX27_PARUN